MVVNKLVDDSIRNAGTYPEYEGEKTDNCNDPSDVH
jgi:hypothetical protein